MGRRLVTMQDRRRYLSITAVMARKWHTAPSYGLVTIGTTSYSSLMRSGIMSLNSLPFLIQTIELAKNSSRLQSALIIILSSIRPVISPML